MLVLTRKENESIMIGDQIKVTVVESSGGQIRLGIEAPQEIEIYREELYQQIKEENKTAAQTKVENLSKLVAQLKQNED
ncbi:MAG: carbon storage regulator CsrA [Bacillota bacterium]